MYKMSGITIEHELQGGEAVEGAETTENLEGVRVDDGDDSAGGGGFDLSFLKSRTGEGPVEEYVNHPLNFNSSPALARIIRGATGIMGELDFALADIAFGLLEHMRGRYSVKAD
ncbi:MAG TPA: hypothetical protein VFG39_01175 [Balneolaceae bacterium]|nr:hypothetical protein [Balneolaceae bacterium]